ncbi:MAG: enoyl-CoA hydratase/isomerase family protein [Gammaproteobacteria bacterium]|nr:enoyl-CoA hydratase/isomerase family protein [Gammaproteobacteria bacterium]
MSSAAKSIPTTTLELNTTKMIAEISDGIGWVTFNNPERLNAISMEMTEAIPVIFDHFQRSDDVRVVVLKGAGDRAFVSGADISEFEKNRSSADVRKVYDESSKNAAAAMLALDKPMIAMIQGYCIGGGLMMALRADMRIASDGSQFAIPAARLGLGYGYGGVVGLVDLVGPAYANEILFTARRFQSDEALRIGLVNRVVSPDALEQTVREVAATIVGNAPLTIRAAKYAIRQTLVDESARDMDQIAQFVEECFQSEDYIEGRRAFMEKRPAAFKGR